MIDMKKDLGKKYLDKIHSLVYETEQTELVAAKKNLLQRIGKAHKCKEDTSMWYLLHSLVELIERLKEFE